MKIGEDVSERLDVIVPKFRVIVTRRPSYACTACRESTVQAPAFGRLIEGGAATERLLASIAVAKYADGRRFIGRKRFRRARVLQAPCRWRVADADMDGQAHDLPCGPSRRRSKITARRRVSGPIVEELQARWEDELSLISGKSKLAEAIRYGLSRKGEFGPSLEERSRRH